MSALSCVDCKGHTSKPVHRCWVKGFEFKDQKDMVEKAKACWSFRDVALDSEPHEGLLQPIPVYES